MILSMPITLLRIWQSWISVWSCFNFHVLWTGRHLFCNSIVHTSSWILVWKLSETFFLYVLNLTTRGLAEFVGGNKHFDRCNKDSSCGHHPRQWEKLKPCCGHRPGDPQHTFGNQLMLFISLKVFHFVDFSIHCQNFKGQDIIQRGSIVILDFLAISVKSELIQNKPIYHMHQ